METIFTISIALFSIAGFSQRDSSVQHKEDAKKRIESIRNEIISGKIDFASAAITYSMDQGSAPLGGLYKNIPRGTFVQEFEFVAWSLNPNVISEVFETQFGYHILLVEAKRGEEMDVRHILISTE